MTPSDDASAASRGHRLPRRPWPAGDDVTRADVGSGWAQEQTPGLPDPTQTFPERSTGATRHLPSEAAPTSRVPAGSASGHGERDAMIGRFEVLDKVGEGGMGVVYRARDPRYPGREVALKVLRPHIAYDPDAQTRLAREVETLERVHHPNVAAVVDADPWGERPFIATEFVPGVPLDKVIAQRGHFAPDQLARLGRDLASAIDAIHEAGVVHRDLKPSNVLMVGDKPVVIDFGIAHIADDARLTSTGLVMGTPGYLSPELVEGAPVSRSTDWWGWAATLAFAAQGEPPFGRGPMPAVLDRVTRGQSNLTGVDERLRPLLAAALSPVPQERPSARQVLEQMERYGRGEATTVVPVRRLDAPPTAVLPPRDATRRAPVAAPPAPYQRRPEVPVANRPQGQPAQQPSGASPAAADPFAAPSRNARPQSRPGEHDPRLGLPQRSGTLQAMFVAWVGLMAIVPVLGFIVLVVWNVATRFADSTITQAVLRRYEAGRRRTDGAVAVASAPWHALRAGLGTLAALVIPAVVFAAVDCVVGIGWAALRGGVPQAFWAGAIVPAAAAAQWVMWRGAGSTTYRRGARSVVRGLVPGGQVTSVVVGVLVALAALCLLIAVGHSGAISWAPLTGGIVDPLSEYLPNTGNPLQ